MGYSKWVGFRTRESRCTGLEAHLHNKKWFRYHAKGIGDRIGTGLERNEIWIWTDDGPRDSDCRMAPTDGHGGINCDTLDKAWFRQDRVLLGRDLILLDIFSVTTSLDSSSVIFFSFFNKGIAGQAGRDLDQGAREGRAASAGLEFRITPGTRRDSRLFDPRGLRVEAETSRPDKRLAAWVVGDTMWAAGRRLGNQLRADIDMGMG